MSRISKESRQLRSTLCVEIDLLKDLLKKSGALLDNTKKPPLKLLKQDRAEMERVLAGLKELIDDKTCTKVIKFRSNVVGDVVLSFLKPIMQESSLAEMATIRLVTLLEAHLKKLFRIILVSRTEMLRTNPQFTAAELLGFRRRSDFVGFLADKEVSDLGYGGIDDVAETFKKKMKLDFSAFPEWSDVRELFSRRNLLVHNQGVTNMKFCRLTGHPETGQELHTDLAYVQRSSDVAQRFADFVLTAVIAKFARIKKPNKVLPGGGG